MDKNNKTMKPKTASEITLFAAILFGVGVLAVKALWPEAYTPVFWVVPAFFYIYEVVFVWLLGRYDKMKAEKVLTTSMIMRGVKFLGVAALMVIYVKLGLAGKTIFLLYTLIYYILTSACESWVVGVHNKNKHQAEN